MKKVMLVSAMVLGFAFAANAQDVKTAKTETAAAVQQEKDYKTIDPVSVNNEALKTVLTKYKGHIIKEAFRAEDGEYKLVLSKDQKSKTVIINKDGKVIKEA